MNELIQTRWLPILLLTGSNIFMTFAWYGHLKYKDIAAFVCDSHKLGHRVF